MSITIYHDDDSFAVLDKVSQELARQGVNVRFEDDNLPHDGYCIINVTLPSIIPDCEKCQAENKEINPYLLSGKELSDTIKRKAGIV